MQDVLVQLLQFVPDNIWDVLFNIFLAVTSVIGVAAAQVKAFAAIAKITPSTKDDEYATKAGAFMGVVVHYLDVVSLGLTAEQARRGKPIK